MKIAFLGLGNMGSGMASRLLAAGYPLHVWNRSPEKAEALVPLGAKVAASPADAVAGADVVISSLMDDASVKSLFDPSGPVVAAIGAGAVHLCVMRRFLPAAPHWLEAMHQAHGSLYVSGPVIGRPDAAKAGSLTQLLAGDRAAIERVEPLCHAFAQRVIQMPGPASVANKQKLCINFFLISVIEAMAEGYTFADKIGASPQMLAVFFEQSFASPGLKQYASKMLARETDGQGGFAMTGGYKDVGLMLAEARSYAGCPLELGEIIAGKNGSGAGEQGNGR